MWQRGGAGAKVVYTYDVYWELSDVSWASRWDAYLRMPSSKPYRANVAARGRRRQGGVHVRRVLGAERRELGQPLGRVPAHAQLKTLQG